MAVRSHVSPDPASAARACARHIVAQLEQALVAQEHATLALSGGSSPRVLFERLAGTPFPWEQVHFFWTDERCVPPSDPQSNYKMAAECLLMPARVPQRNIHRVHGELMPHVAARMYDEEIRRFFGLERGEHPRFDVVHLGIGPDAHTASLFPGEPLIEERQGIAAAVRVEKLGSWRVTLLPAALTAARQAVFFAPGAEKAEAVRATFNEPLMPVQYPAQVVARQARNVFWFLDTASAARLATE